MPNFESTFPFAVNNFAGQLVKVDSDDAMSVRHEDAVALAAAGAPKGRPIKLVLIAAANVDAEGRLTDTARRMVFCAGVVNTSTDQLVDTVLADNSAKPGLGGEGTAGTYQTFSTGDLIRCEPTAGMLNETYASINTLEKFGIPRGAAAYFGPNGEYLPPTLPGFDFANGSLYFEPVLAPPNNVFTSGQPFAGTILLVRKDAFGNETTLA